MNIQFVDFIFNQKGTKIDLSHFVSTLINMNDTLVTYNKFTSDNLDATLDVHDTTDAGIRIFTKEIECFVYGIIVSSTDITQIPTFKDNKVELKDIQNGIFLNVFILNKSDGKGAYAYYRGSLSIHNFTRALNKYYSDTLGKDTHKKNIIRPMLGYEEFERYIQHNFERIDAFVIDDTQDNQALTNSVALFSEGAYAEVTTMIKCKISPANQEGFYTLSRTNSFFDKIMKVIGINKDGYQSTIDRNRKKRVSLKLEINYNMLLIQMAGLENLTTQFTEMQIFEELKSKI